jgi:hypothetical protein
VTQLIQVLSESKKITINQTAASDFLDYDGLMKHLYKDLKLLVKKNHIFDNDHLVANVVVVTDSL